MNQITTVGVDLAKEVIVVCAGDAQGRSVYFKQFSFTGFAEWRLSLRPVLLGWKRAARLITGRGFWVSTTIRRSLWPPNLWRRFVKVREPRTIAMMHRQF